MKVHSRQSTIIVAHRGASYRAPENTLPAFRLAFKEDADYIEGDFWMTADGHLVCIHDPHPQRVTRPPVKMDVRKHPLIELKKLDVGNWKGPEFKGTTIPTLPEVLQTIPAQKGLFLEIKDSRIEFLQRLKKELQNFPQAARRIRLIAFDPLVIQNARDHFPEYKIYWLYNWYLARETGKLSNSPEEILQMLKQLPCDGLNLNPFPWIDVDFVEQLREMKMDFCLYNVNRFEDALKYLTLGVDAIATNCPGKIRKQIEQYFSPEPLSNKQNERLEIHDDHTFTFFNNPQDQ